MKKIIAILLALCLCIGLCACKKDNSTLDNTQQPPTQESVVPETTVPETTVPETINQYEVLYTYLNNNHNYTNDSLVGIKTYSDNFFGKGDIYILCETENQTYCFSFFQSEQGINSQTSLYFSEADEDARIHITASSSKIDIEMFLDIPKSEIYDFGNTKKSAGILYSYVTKESGYGADGTTVTSTIATHLDIMREEIVEYFENNNVDVDLVDLGFENIFVDKS
jgi:hypothetical protein